MEKKNSAVEIIEAVVHPLDPSIAGVKVRLDLSRPPKQIAKDFVRALQNHPAIALTYREQDPRLFQALALAQRHELSFREASRRVYSHEGKASALCRMAANARNAAIAATGDSDAEKH